MKRIIFATGNQNKAKEVREIFAGLPYEVLSMKEAGYSSEPEENGTTYAENALIKARALREIMLKDMADKSIKASGDGTGQETAELPYILADDSGFEVDYLNKEPGVYSSRFMGEDTSYTIKNKAIIDKLAGVPDEQRTARFMCDIAIIFPDGREAVTEASYEGFVAYEAKGTNGFGYDPIFVVHGYGGLTDAELPSSVKNTIGHRGKALAKAREIIEKGT